MSDPPLPKRYQVDQTESLLETYQDKQQEFDHRRRRENVHVLVALGVIGGFISFASSGDGSIFSDGITQIAVQILVSISGIYLIAKMTTITLRPEYESKWIEIFDERIEPVLYMVSIYGLIIIVGINYISSGLPEIPQSVILGVQGLLFAGLLIGIMYWAGRARMYGTVKTEERLRNNLAKILSLLRNDGDIEDSHGQELVDRFERILRTRDEIERVHLLGSMVSETDFFTLTRADRRRLNNVLERIEIKKAQDRPISSDIETLEEILETIEER